MNNNNLMAKIHPVSEKVFWVVNPAEVNINNIMLVYPSYYTKNVRSIGIMLFKRNKH
jgi:hypothetical protein